MRAIVVVDKNWGIGKGGGLLFRLDKDMAFFRATTLDKVVVMGAKTYASLPHGALPRRVNVVLDDSGRSCPDAITADSVQALRSILAGYESDNVFVIGGASVYALLLDDCREALVTKVDADGGAELFFPNLDKMPDWRLAEQGEPTRDNGYTTVICRYVRADS